jgi:hypothetical protein
MASRTAASDLRLDLEAPFLQLGHTADFQRHSVIDRKNLVEGVF